MALAIDASTPALANAATTQASLASNSFSPPGSSLLVVVTGSSFHGTGGITSITDSLGAHLTYTKLTAIATGNNVDAEVWVADVPSSAPGSMTVTVNCGSTLQPSVGVIVMTGAQNAAAQVSNANTKTGTAINPPSLTSPNAMTAGSQCVFVVGDWSSSGPGTAGSGQTQTVNGHAYNFVNSTQGTGWWAQVLTADSAGGATQTMNTTGASSGISAQVLAEILAAPSGGAAHSLIVPNRISRNTLLRM